MAADFGKLIDLQDIDLQIHELVVSSEQFPVQVAEMEAQLAASLGQNDELNARVKQIESERSEAEQAITEAQEAVERSQGRLSTIRTNREYDALHMELESNQSAISSAKSKLDALDAEKGRVEDAIAEGQTQLEELKGELEPKIADLKARIAAIDGQKAELQSKRDAVAAEVPPQHLRAYEHILKRRKSGKALSFAGPDSKTCAVCHKVLEPQVVNELRAARRLTICQSCGSILLWQEEGQTDSVSASE
jgi:predicted  nucleic acid-binding Zn-ribbon protein